MRLQDLENVSLRSIKLLALWNHKLSRSQVLKNRRIARLQNHQDWKSERLLLGRKISLFGVSPYSNPIGQTLGLGSLSDFSFEGRSSFSGNLASLTASNLSKLLFFAHPSLQFWLNFSSFRFLYVQNASLIGIFGLCLDLLLFWWQWRSFTSFYILTGSRTPMKLLEEVRDIEEVRQ